MESSILFLGPVGVGKTQAIQTISEIEVISTEVRPTDEVALAKSSTTVSMDMGVLHMDETEKLVIYGAPGQARFDFMWDILLSQTQGIILLISHAAADPVADLDYYMGQIRARLKRSRPVVVGISHVDCDADRPLSPYSDHLSRQAHACTCELCCPPVLRVDPRRQHDVRTLLITLVALLEMSHRFPAKGCSR